MKTIGIKLADGSFYPVLQEGSASEKKLDLTTAHNNQTKVMVDLYRSANCTMDDAEYVDSLQIENLIAHPNGEPDISFSVSLDENNELSAKIVDTETGKQSNTSITLVSRTQEERLITDEYDISDSKEDKSTGKVAAGAAVAGVGLLAAAAALRAKEEKDTEVEFKPAANDEIPSEEEVFAEEDLPAGVDETIVEDDIPSEENIPPVADETIVEENIPVEEEVTSTTDDLSSDDSLDDTLADMPDLDFNLPEETPEETPTITEDDFVMEESPADGEEISSAADDTFADDTFVSDEIPTDEDIPVDEDISATDDINFDFPGDDTAEYLANDKVPADETITDKTITEDTFAEDNPLADDTFTEDNPLADETFAEDNPLADDTISDNADDFDLPDFSDIPSDTDLTSDKNDDIFNMDDDFLDNSNSSDDIPASNGISFTGLYDKDDLNGSSSSFSDDEEDEKKKTKVPVIICIICAIICIIATVLILFIIPSKYNLFSKKDSQEKAPVEKVIEAEPSPAPVVASEPEPKPEPEPVPPAKEEEIVIIEKAEEVVPEQPKVTEKKPENISYKIKWGDTLWDIADTYYKNPWRYRYIARWNGIKDPDVIISGTYIIIPAE